MTKRITIKKPDDWHLHVRDGEMLKAVLPYTAKNFGRAILMPNLIPPSRHASATSRTTSPFPSRHRLCLTECSVYALGHRQNPS